MFSCNSQLCPQQPEEAPGSPRCGDLTGVLHDIKFPNDPGYMHAFRGIAFCIPKQCKIKKGNLTWRCPSNSREVPVQSYWPASNNTQVN